MLIIPHAKNEGNIIYYLLFIPNIPWVIGGEIPFLGHFWSIGVEEQFYSFWPILIKYSKKILNSLLIFAAVFFAIKVFCNLYFGGWSIPYSIIYSTRFDCMT